MILLVYPLFHVSDSNIPTIELSEEEDDVDVIYHDLESLNEHLIVIKSFRPHYRTETPDLDDEGSYTNGKLRKSFDDYVVIPRILNLSSYL